METEEKRLEVLDADTIRAEKPTFSKIILRQVDRVNSSFSRGVDLTNTSAMAVMVSVEGSLVGLESCLVSSLQKNEDARKKIAEIKYKIERTPLSLDQRNWKNKLKLYAKWYAVLISVLGEYGILPAETAEGVE